jgi:hypothetical protein
MPNYEHPPRDAASLLAADVLSLERQLDEITRERDILRDMLSQSLGYSHALLRELYMQRSNA